MFHDVIYHLPLEDLHGEIFVYSSPRSKIPFLPNVGCEFEIAGRSEIFMIKANQVCFDLIHLCFRVYFPNLKIRSDETVASLLEKHHWEITFK